MFTSFRSLSDFDHFHKGGLKAVLWTDALQAIIMIGSVLAVTIAGTMQIGGPSVVWDRAVEAGRLDIVK